MEPGGVRAAQRCRRKPAAGRSSSTTSRSCRHLHPDRRRARQPVHPRLHLEEPKRDGAWRQRPGPGRQRRMRPPGPNRATSRPRPRHDDRTGGRVFIIGAGPGDPGLITARGVRLLAEADVVVYDRAVEAALRWARPGRRTHRRRRARRNARRRRTRSRCSLAEKARDGHTVARLKWGDPFVFDSGAKEAMFLHEQGVPFEVVPGVPAAIGATAYAGIPAHLSRRRRCARAAARPRGRGRRDARRRLGRAGADRRHDRLLRRRAARAQRCCRRCSITAPPADARRADLSRHAAGAAHGHRHAARSCCERAVGRQPTTNRRCSSSARSTSLRDHLRWFDERPLFGRRIVVTRSPEQARELVDALENLGAQAIEAPTFRLAPPEDPEAVDRAAASLDEYHWVVFESATAVARFLVGAHARTARSARARRRRHLRDRPVDGRSARSPAASSRTS